MSPRIAADAVGMMRTIFTMPFPWNLWVILMGALNVAGGLVYWGTLEGRLALGAIAGAAVVMLGVYSRYGFVRLMGFGHLLFWIPLVAFFLHRLNGDPGPEGAFRMWLWSIVIVNGASLVLDLADVVRYAMGEREDLSG